MRANGYPLTVINKCIYTFFEKVKKDKITDENVGDDPPETLSLFLSYLGTASLSMKKKITWYIKQNIPNCKLRIIFSSKTRLSNFFKFKDTMPASLQSHLVYKIQCAECNLCYIGLLERHFKVRSYDHLGMSISTNKPIKGVQTSMKTHWRENNHHITMDSIKVIARAENSFHLRIKESLLIKRDRPVLNNNIYSTPLYLF